MTLGLRAGPYGSFFASGARAASAGIVPPSPSVLGLCAVGFVRRRTDRRPAADRWESTQVLQVTRRDGEDSEQLVRRFNKLVQRDGVLQEARRRRHFISNREKERQAQRRAARRRRRTTKPSR